MSFLGVLTWLAPSHCLGLAPQKEVLLITLWPPHSLPTIVSTVLPAGFSLATTRFILGLASRCGVTSVNYRHPHGACVLLFCFILFFSELYALLGLELMTL